MIPLYYKKSIFLVIKSLKLRFSPIFGLTIGLIVVGDEMPDDEYDASLWHAFLYLT